MPEYRFSLNHWLREKCPNTEFFFGPYIPRIQFECGKIRTRKNSVFGHFCPYLPSGLFLHEKNNHRFPCDSVLILEYIDPVNYVKNDQIRRIFCSVFSCSPTEYRKIRTRKTSVFGNFSRNGESPYSGIFYIASVKQGSSYPFSRI